MPWVRCPGLDAQRVGGELAEFLLYRLTFFRALAHSSAWPPPAGARPGATMRRYVASYVRRTWARSGATLRFAQIRSKKLRHRTWALAPSEALSMLRKSRMRRARSRCDQKFHSADRPICCLRRRKCRRRSGHGRTGASCGNSWQSTYVERGYLRPAKYLASYLSRSWALVGSRRDPSCPPTHRLSSTKVSPSSRRCRAARALRVPDVGSVRFRGPRYAVARRKSA